MLHFLNLIRWKNLLIIILTQYLIKYTLFISSNIPTTLRGYEFMLLVFATISIAASGNIINDIFDIETDEINKPKKVIINRFISKKLACGYYLLLSFIGVCIGIYLSNLIGSFQLSLVFIAASILLYFYSFRLKQTFLIGNIIVSLLVALSIIIIGLFEISSTNKDIQITTFRIIIHYSFFAFSINLLREIVKDLQDVKGDYNSKMQTLPIILGRARSTKVVFSLSILFIFFIIYYVVANFLEQWIAIIYFLVFVIIPLLYFAFKIFHAETKEEFKTLSTILKLVMLTGLLSLLLYPLVLN